MLMLKVCLVLSAAAVVIAAPADSGSADVDSTGALSTDQKMSSEDSVVANILDKLDKADITEAIKEQMSTRSDISPADSSSKNMKTSEIGVSVDTAKKSTDNMYEDSQSKTSETKNPEIMQKKTDVVEKMQMNDDFKVSDGMTNADVSIIIDKKLKDVASAVAEAVTSLPVPVRPETPSKYTEIIGHFISELLQIPMVLLHAVSNAIASLTNNKVTIPTPGFLQSAPTLPPR